MGDKKERETRQFKRRKKSNIERTKLSGAVFIKEINFIITNIKFKICTYFNISYGLMEMIFINIYSLTTLINS
jgi:hypothetical protein